MGKPMKTSVAVLAEKLGDNNVAWRSSAGHALTLTSVRAWSAALAEPRDNVLWVCDSKNAEQLAGAGASVAVASMPGRERADALADRLFAESGETAEILVAHTKSANELANRLMDVKESLMRGMRPSPKKSSHASRSRTSWKLRLSPSLTLLLC